MRNKLKLTRPIGQFTFAAWALLSITVLIPIVYGIYISFLDIKLSSFLPPRFVGLDNYIAALKAPETWATLKLTLVMMLIGLIIQIPLGIGLALILHRKLKGTKLFTSILITPMLLTPVAVGLTFRFMFDTDLGIINWVIGAFGVEKINWLGQQATGIFAVVLVDSWQSVPFVMLLILAAIGAISPSLYEAASIDGANARQVFWRVTFPLITPTLLVVVMIKIMDFLKLFDTLFILTRGGPGNETTTLGLWTYKTGFIFLDFSRAAALGVLIMIITAPVLLLWRRSTKEIK